MARSASGKAFVFLPLLLEVSLLTRADKIIGEAKVLLKRLHWNQGNYWEAISVTCYLCDSNLTQEYIFHCSELCVRTLL